MKHVSQTGKDKHMIYIWNLKNKPKQQQTHRYREQMVARGERKGRIIKNGKGE